MLCNAYESKELRFVNPYDKLFYETFSLIIRRFHLNREYFLKTKKLCILNNPPLVHLHHKVVHRCLSDVLQNGDLVDMLIQNYLCDTIDYFSMPEWLQKTVEHHHCVTQLESEFLDIPPEQQHPYRRNYKISHLFGYLHCRNDEPIYTTECALWIKMGLLHRDNDQHALVMYNEMNEKFWFKRGIWHRDHDRPAYESHNGNGAKIWVQHGVINRIGDLPAVMGAHYTYRNPSGYKHDVEIRYLGKPRRNFYDRAMFNPIFPDHNQEYSVWLKNGKLHRDKDLPAIVGTDGAKLWFKNGKQHRDGILPAVLTFGYHDSKQDINIPPIILFYKNGKEVSITENIGKTIRNFIGCALLYK